MKTQTIDLNQMLELFLLNFGPVWHYGLLEASFSRLHRNFSVAVQSNLYLVHSSDFLCVLCLPSEINGGAVEDDFTSVSLWFSLAG